VRDFVKEAGRTKDDRRKTIAGWRECIRTHRTLTGNGMLVGRIYTIEEVNERGADFEGAVARVFERLYPLYDRACK
jgi:hypothetical protein